MLFHGKLRVQSYSAGSVFTTLENGMDASPTERQSTGTVSLLDDGPQRSTSVFSSLSFSLFFVIHIFIRVDSTTQHFSTALSADSGSVGRHDYSSESSAKKVTVYAELINKVYQLPSVKRKDWEEDRAPIPAERPTKKGRFCWKDMWPTGQVWWETIKSGTIQADFCMKSLEEQRVIKNVKGSTQIQQHKNSIVSSINHYQQIVKYAKEGCLSAMTTSVRRLKLDIQTVCVEVYLVGNRSLKDLGQIG